MTFFSPAADRNKQPILDVLQQLLPSRGRALEIASGTGQHVCWFAAALPGWTWQPTDWQADAFATIEEETTARSLPNVLPPRLLDVLSPGWGFAADLQRFDAIYCANMLHISPWATTAALMHGSARCLAAGGVLVTYGPYLEGGVATSEGNLAFDASLRAQNADWGIRRREAVEEEAAKAGLRLVARHAMPADNLLLAWKADRD